MPRCSAPTGWVKKKECDYKNKIYLKVNKTAATASWGVWDCNSDTWFETENGEVIENTSYDTATDKYQDACRT